MNTQPAETPAGTQFPRGVELILLPRAHDLGGFEVRRALPAHERQMIGPFIFFDQMGPGEFLAGRGLDVRPHPHIGLATVTYLFEGEILHRDSLGSRQPIVPGDVNWMTAGSGIAHSERTDPGLRIHNNRLFGIQSWVALPQAAEEVAPSTTVVIFLLRITESPESMADHESKVMVWLCSGRGDAGNVGVGTARCEGSHAAAVRAGANGVECRLVFGWFAQRRAA
jgi:redox-sensitive bicupin YhaK (pirin superfamily)